MKKKVEEVFKTIDDSAQEGDNLPKECKIEKIIQVMEDYNRHIIEFMTLLQQINPLEVRT